MNPNQIFNNKKVLIMGLGTKGGGLASAKFAYKHGAASITITDLQDADYLKDTLIQLVDIPKTLILGQHRMEDFENHDIIIKNPGIKNENQYLQHAIKHNKTIETPISLFTKIYRKPYIGITGTKGKSYTTALVTHLLSAFNENIVAAGNNCVSPLDYLDQDKTFVLELSSWQLHEMGTQKKSPHIACWLNFFPDHMNYYANIDEYFADKLQIACNQSKKDYLIVPYGYTKLRNIKTKAHKILFSVDDLSDVELNDNESVCYINSNTIIYRGLFTHEKIISITDIGSLFAAHQLELMLASICIAIVYAKYNNFTLSFVKQALSQQLLSFKGLEYRFQTIYKQSEFAIINDSAASTPESAIVALQSCQFQPIILITGGGSHKNLSYNKLAKEIVTQNAFVIFYSNDETSLIIRKELTQIYYDKYLIVDGLIMAIQQAMKLSLKSTGTILFSPACSGYPIFKDMFDRGKQFETYVNNMITRF